MASIAGQGLKLNLKSNSDKTDASDSIYPTQKSYTSMSFKDKYSIHERIGKGAYATVHRCRRKSDDKDFAVKNIDIRPLKLQNTYDPDRIIREVRVHGTLVHPNIVKLEETYWTRSDGSVPLSPSEYDRLLIVLEYAPGKELFDEILEMLEISTLSLSLSSPSITHSLQDQTDLRKVTHMRWRLSIDCVCFLEIVSLGDGAV